jgi:hypothetical protein
MSPANGGAKRHTCCKAISRTGRPTNRVLVSVAMLPSICKPDYRLPSAI